MLDPVELAALAAYGWLVLAALIFVVRGAGDVGVPTAWGSLDAARHAIGAGYVTLLIYGVGARLLPGFANLPLRDVRLVWAALGIGFVAVLLRVIPELLAVGQADALLASAGALGLVGVVCFWWSVPATARDR